MTGGQRVRTQIVAGQHRLQALHFEGKAAQDERTIPLSSPLVELGDEPIENAKKLRCTMRRQRRHRGGIRFSDVGRERVLLKDDRGLRLQLLGERVRVQQVRFW